MTVDISRTAPMSPVRAPDRCAIWRPPFGKVGIASQEVGKNFCSAEL